MSLSLIRSALRGYGDPSKALVLQRFFKTGPGEYAAWDLFMGINVPVLRSLAKKYQSLSLGEVLHLLKSRIHEERLLSLLILILKYRAGDLVVKKKIYRAYLAHTAYIFSGA